MGYAPPPQTRPFAEESWSELGPAVTPYVKSKTLAERAAWDFMTRVGGPMDLAVINPAAIFGPVLGPDYATSVQIIAQMLSGALPGLPHLSYGVVDVRDVADLHLRAMTQPAAGGQRFLATAGMLTLQEMAQVLKARLGQAAGRVSTRALPDWLGRVMARGNQQAAEVVPHLGQTRKFTRAKAQRVLGWAPRAPGEAVAATAESLLRLGLVQSISA